MTVPSLKTIQLFVPTTWRGGVARAVQSFMPSPAIEHLKDVAGEDMFRDTLDYLEQAYRAAGATFSSSTRADLTNALLGEFEYFRSYHGCRPLAFDSYFREGLQPLTRERLAEIAFALFEGTVPRAEIDGLSQTAKLSLRLGHVFFTADRDELISHCGHYLIYGPEALSCLWRDPNDRPTPRFLESQERYRTRGIPTVFECDVPVDWIPESSRDGLATTLVTQFFQLESRQPVSPDYWSRNWGYSIERSLPPEFIRHHFHPTTIPDPLHHRSQYRNPHARCSYCAPSSEPQRIRPGIT